jgi:O-antigen/teichoic acid export membrane protein
MLRSIITSATIHGPRRNVLFALGQGLIIMLCLFLSYRILIAEKGIESLGLWSLVMIFTGVAATLDISGASALARFVARHEIEFPQTSRSDVIHTVLVSSLAINGLLLSILMLNADWLFALVIGPKDVIAAQELLKWVATLFLINPLAVGISASLDGLMRADLRAILLSCAAVLGLLVNWFAIPALGLLGFALGQLVQQMTVVTIGWLLLGKRVPNLGWLPFRWSSVVFFNVAGYTIRLNFIGIIAWFFEPLAKYFLNVFGGMASVGLYELASKIAMQFRTLINGALMPMVPAFASERDPNSPKVREMLNNAQLVVSLGGCIVALASVVSAPVISLLIMKHVSLPLLQMNAILSFGWGINLMGAAYYLLAQAHGVLRWNALAHLAIGIVLTAFSLLASKSNAALTVVSGIAIGLTASFLVTVVGNALQFGLWGSLKQQTRTLLVSIVNLGAICSFAFWVSEMVAKMCFAYCA